MDEGFTDDPTIGDEAALWRRIGPKWVVYDENVSAYRVSSAAFDNSEDGSPTSVLLAELVRESGRNAEDVIAAFDGYALALITAGQARDCDQGVERAPDVNEPAHAYMFGMKTRSVRRRLARYAEWVVAPAGSV